MAAAEPIKSTADLDVVRSVLTDPRDRALFEISLGTGFRGGDILSLTLKDVQSLNVGDDLVLREQKTGKRRRVTVNASVVSATRDLLAERLSHGAKPTDPLFISQSNGSRGSPLTRTSLTRLWKHWCDLAGLDGNFGSHTGRKSLGYLSRVEDGVAIEVISKLLNHQNSAVTRAYICVQDDELKAIYMKPRTHN